ncbi:glutamic acid-rich protein-like [Helianthus annuus]|uniref:glutamic acid-rich protein-like n=1 Tax=Helianthus annuus TaxID=4232 RepID=UPI000B8F28F5|nr:glutamic acid-rich protein-like [Helianthus annuus]
MNRVTALVLNKKYNFSHIVFHYMIENITTKSKTWTYPRFVQMLIDHAYPEIERELKNDLLVQSHMSNDSLKQLARYHPNHPEPKIVAEFFGFIKDANSVDPDPIDHQNWRNEEEMKEAAYADELKTLEEFKTTRNDWFVKETRRRGKKVTPKSQEGEGSSSQPKKKQKKVAKTLLIDEPDVKELVVTAEEHPYADIDQVMLNVDDLVTEQAANVKAEKEKVIDDVEGDDVNKSTTSSSSSSDEEIDETECLRRIQEATEKEKQLRKRKRQEKDDAAYVPSPEHVFESQSPSSGKKKAGARKRIVSPKIKKVTTKITKPKIVLKKKPSKEPSKQPTPPPEPTPHQPPIQSPRQPTPPPHQTRPRQPSPPKQPTPPRQPSPLHLSPLHLSPPQQQTLFTSQEIFQTPPLTQIQLTPGSSGHKGLHIPPDNLEDIGDFGFANDEQVKKLEKKMDDVLNENKIVAAESKKVAEREKILEMRVKKLESDNKALLKKIDTDQTEIDFLKVRVAELEEEKARRDEQNKYFEMKNKELEAAKALKEHEFYMLNKVVENMLGTSIEERFEEIQVEELRAKCQAEIDEQMKDKGKGAESSVAAVERSIVPSLVIENPVPISSVSAIFEEHVSLEDLAADDDEEDDEEGDDEEGDEEEGDDEEDDDDEKVFSASSHGSDNDDGDAQGGMGIKVNEQSSERTVDDFLNDTVNEETGGAEGKGEHGDDQNVKQVEKLILRLETDMEEGEHRHTYSLEEIKEMTRMVDPDYKFDFEEELNAFDINHQPEYEYKYVEDADMYDRVEVEDCTDDESVSEDTSKYHTLMEFFTEENRDELRRKVAEILKDKNFDGTPKDM